jgi:hypothetical protein
MAAHLATLLEVDKRSSLYFIIRDQRAHGDKETRDITADEWEPGSP